MDKDRENVMDRREFLRVAGGAGVGAAGMGVCLAGSMGAGYFFGLLQQESRRSISSEVPLMNDSELDAQGLTKERFDLAWSGNQVAEGMIAKGIHPSVELIKTGDLPVGYKVSVPLSAMENAVGVIAKLDQIPNTNPRMADLVLPFVFVLQHRSEVEAVKAIEGYVLTDPEQAKLKPGRSNLFNFRANMGRAGGAPWVTLVNCDTINYAFQNGDLGYFPVASFQGAFHR